MSKITCYNDLLDKIQDERLKKAFIEMTKDYDIKNMNNHSLDVMNVFTNVPYINLKKDNYLHMLFLSEPEFWIFYMYDKDFLIFVKESWTDFKDLVNNYNEDEMKKELNFEDFENSRKNLQKMKLVTNLLQEMYPEIFN